MSKVSWAVAWPRRRCTTVTEHPDEINMEAKKCRSSWNPSPGAMHTRSPARRKIGENELSLIPIPRSLVKINPSAPIPYF